MFATAASGDPSACGVSAADGATAAVASEATAEVFFSIRADPAATSAGGGGTSTRARDGGKALARRADVLRAHQGRIGQT